MRELHAEGKNNNEIAAALSAEFGTKRQRAGVGVRLRKMGLNINYVKPVGQRSTAGIAAGSRAAIERRVQTGAVVALPGIDLMELKNTTCRYPVHDKPYRFCGEPTVEGSSYCAAHAAICSDKKRTSEVNGRRKTKKAA